MASSALDLRDRAALFNRLTAETFDVLVIGGGITGAGIVRDAAMRGLRTALVEAYDFGAGTSSRSTKLVHGGLRYLAQGDNENDKLRIANLVKIFQKTKN